jgi:hypothetical protein
MRDYFGGFVANQFENRTGLKAVTAGEGLNTDPMLLAIVAPRPSSKAFIHITLGEMEYTFGPGEFVGPNDSHERGLGWDRTFEWGQQEGAARDLQDQVVSLLHDWKLCKSIDVQHEKGQPYGVVVNGRHTVLAARIAHLILRKMGREPKNIGFRRREYDEARAALAADVANRSYKRDPIAVLEQRLYEIGVNGWDDAAAARHFRVSPATIRGWRHKVNGETKAPAEKAPRPMPRKRLTKLAEIFEAHHDEQSREMGQLIRYVLNPASKPPAWLKAYLKEE